MDILSCKGCLRTGIITMAENTKDIPPAIEVTVNGNIENGFNDSPRKYNN